MKNTIIATLALAVLLTLSMTSCTKEDLTDGTGDGFPCALAHTIWCGTGENTGYELIFSDETYAIIDVHTCDFEGFPVLKGNYTVTEDRVLLDGTPATILCGGLETRGYGEKEMAFTLNDRTWRFSLINNQ